ncbi:MAG: fibronectin type III domain-containing protein, partial [Ruminococcus sp.]|nr:fibronectin type III domain-containing protein [Candidatus Copronaster equi]
NIMDNFKPVVRFMTVSDIHLKDYKCVEEDRFRDAIRYGYKIAKNHPDYKKLDALVIVGDYADGGTETQFTKAKNIVDSEINKNETTVIAQIASHETNNFGIEVASERHKRIMGCDLDMHKVINGFHFISCSPTIKCNYDDIKKKWMYENLKEAQKDNHEKPIFVFQHPHNTDTVYGGKLWGEEDLMSIYMNFPQIIHFSGHSHAPINDPRSVHQQHFTCFGTGTLSYFELDEFDKITSTFPLGREKAAQMLIVEADENNRVRVYPFDVITGNFFPYVWDIDKPSDPTTFKYTNKRYRNPVLPYFTNDAEIKFSEVTKNSFKIEFNQAVIDKDYVNSYDITVRNSDGYTIRHLSIWSDYYFYDMPKTLSYKFDDLEESDEYTVEITANGFWYNSSENSLTGKVKTREVNE